MGFVHPEKPDVFFSYARVDDNPIFGSEDGWVHILFKRLGWEIDRNLGRKDACRLWMDYELPANAKLDEALPATVRSSALMLVILSKGYQESPWCQGEMLDFLTAEAERRGTGPTSGLFLVALDNEVRPAPLKALNLVAKEFYQVDPFTKKVRTEGRLLADWQEYRFTTKVMDLAKEIADELQRRRPAEAEAGGRSFVSLLGNGHAPEIPPMPPKRVSSAVPGPDAPKVFLAEVPDGQEHLRIDIRNYLAMEGYRVVPADRYPTAVPAEFEKAVRADLAGAKVFAQLLGKNHGALLDGTNRRRLVVQYDLAREFAREKTLLIVSGRRRTIDPEKLAAPNPDDPDDVIDPNYLTLLRHPRIVPFDTIEEFKRAIVDRVKEALKPPKPVVVPRPGSTLVLVHADELDRPFADQVKKALKDRGAHADHSGRRGQREGDPEESGIEARAVRRRDVNLRLGRVELGGESVAPGLQDSRPA